MRINLKKYYLRNLIKNIAIAVVSMIVLLLMIVAMRQSDFSKINKYDKKDKTPRVISYQKKPSMHGLIPPISINTDSSLANLGNFVFNVAGDKKLIANISLKYNSNATSWFNKDDIEDEILKKNTIIRDAIIDTMIGHNNASANSKQMRKDLKENINKTLSNGKIQEVYFNEFILQ